MVKWNRKLQPIHYKEEIEHSSWNRNTHIIKKELINRNTHQKETYQKGTLILSIGTNRNTHQKETFQTGTLILKKEELIIEYDNSIYSSSSID